MMYKGFILLRTKNRKIAESVENIFKDIPILIKINEWDSLNSILESSVKAVILDMKVKDYEKVYKFFSKNSVGVIKIGKEGDLMFPFDADELLEKIDEKKLYTPYKRAKSKDKLINFVSSYKNKTRQNIGSLKTKIKDIKKKKKSKDEFLKYSIEKTGLKNKPLETKKESFEEFDPFKLKDKRVISFISTKGGVGKTTLLVNTAKKLEDIDENTVLLDFDRKIGSSDISMFLNLPKFPNINSLSMNITKENFLKSLVKPKGSNFYVLQCSPKIKNLDEKIYPTILNYSKERFKAVLINLPLKEDIYKEVLKRSDCIVLAVTDHLGCLERMKAFSDKVLEKLDIKKIVFYNKYKKDSYNPEEILDLLKPNFLILAKYKSEILNIYKNQKFIPTEISFSKSVNEMINKIWDIDYLSLI